MFHNKLAVTLWNYKGGVGKSTISLILAEIAATQGLRTLAIDLDEQHNLTEAIALTGSTFHKLEVRTTLEPDFAQEDFDFFVLDTHPTKDDNIKNALHFADIVLVPVFTDFLSIMNLRSVFDYITSNGLGAGQSAIVNNCSSKLKASIEIESILDEQGYPSAGKLPRNNMLVKNIATGDRWDKSLRANQREPFLALYSNLWEAFSSMCAGNFSNLWR